MANKTLKSLNFQALILSVLFILLPLLGLPPFRTGYFIQCEAVYVGLWFHFSFTLLWFSYLLKRRPYLAKNLLNNPVTKGFVLIGVCSCLTALSTPSRAISAFFGSNNTPDGILTFFSIAFAVVPLRLVFLKRSFRPVFLGFTMVSALMVLIPTLLSTELSPIKNLKFWTWATFFYPDFMGFVIVGLLPLYYFIRKDFSLKKIYILDSLFIVLVLISSYGSSNKALTVGALLALIFCVIVRFFPFFNKKALCYLGIFFLIIAITVFICAYELLFINLVPQHLSGTFLSRTYLTGVTFLDYFHKPINSAVIKDFFFGHGYGAFSKATIENIGFFDSFHIYKDAKVDFYSEYVYRDLLCAHNVFLDAFYGGGILGVFSFVYLFYGCLKNLQKNTFYPGVFFYTIFLILLVMWFEPINVMPFTLAAQTIFIKRSSSKGLCFNLSQPFLKLTSIVVLLVTSFHLYFLTYIQAYWLRDFHFGLITSAFTNSFARTYDAYQGAYRQVPIVRNYLKSILTYTDDPKSTERKELLSSYLELIKDMLQVNPTINPNAIAVAFNGLSTLMNRPYVKEHLDIDEVLTLWKKASQLLVKYLPYRVDLQIPYLTYLQTQPSAQEEFINIMSQYQKTAPNSCVLLWFKGLNALKNPQTKTAGLCLMKRALDKGIEGFLPLEKEMVEKIKSSAQACF